MVSVTRDLREPVKQSADLQGARGISTQGVDTRGAFNVQR